MIDPHATLKGCLSDIARSLEKIGWQGQAGDVRDAVAALTDAHARAQALEGELRRVSQAHDEQLAFNSGVLSMLMQPNDHPLKTGMERARYQQGRMLVKPLLDEFASRADRALARAEAADLRVTQLTEEVERLKGELRDLQHRREGGPF